MTLDFKESRTKENLMRAFAGESQARNRYTISAESVKKKGLYAVSQIFLFTAEQERAHAQRFYELLKSLSGTNIQIDGGYPVDYSDSAGELLKMAQHNEMEEFETVYPTFGDIAEGEGFLEAASTFRQIAKIEEIHGKRFGKLAELLESGQYYESEQGSGWMCLNCGHIQRGKTAPEVCPVCRHEKGYFIPVGLAPYLGCLT